MRTYLLLILSALFLAVACSSAETSVTDANSAFQAVPTAKPTTAPAATPEPTATALPALVVERAQPDEPSGDEDAVTSKPEAELDLESASGQSEEEFLPMVTTSSPDPVLVAEIELSLVSSGYTKAVFLTHAGDERLFVVEQRGIISIIENGQSAETPFLDIEERVGSRGSEQGLLSAVFHPNYPSNGRFFVYYTDLEGETVVSEFSVGSAPNTADASSERIILRVPQPYRNHNGGQMHFDAQGYLFIGLGDGGSGGDPDYNGLDPTTLLGSILRIDVDDAQPYAVPVDNPFVGNPERLDEIWAWGLRNPWRFSFDRVTDDLYIGDVGQNKVEEISFEAAESAGGVNFGWNAFEGSSCFTDECNTIEATLPILEYGRDSGCSITGGYVYRGSELPSLWGNYLYSDFCTGTIWASVEPAAGAWSSATVLESGLNVSSFGEDANGELYVIHHGGEIYKITGASAP